MTEENKELRIGTKMIDGSIYAGISPTTNKPLYAMPEDASVAMMEIMGDYLEDWNELPDNMGLTMNFNKAAKHAQTLNRLQAHGHNDWRLPTKEELEVLHQNKNEGSLKGTFNVKGGRDDNADLYWSSTPSPDNSDDNEYQYAYVKEFSGGPVELNPTVFVAAARYVRG